MASFYEYVEIDKNKVVDDLVQEVHQPAVDAPPAVDVAEVPADADQAAEELVKDLDTLSQAKINQPDGGLRVLINDTHISLRGAIWEIVRLGVELTVEHANPVSVIFAIGRAVRGIADKVTRIEDPLELLVLRSIVRGNAAKKRAGKMLAAQQVNAHEIEADLEKQGIPAPNLSELLACLHAKDIVKEIAYAGGPYYAVTF
jgi:hypothetical protein